ncbi:hypothetical protein SAMN05444972_105291 [Marininema halotolerans]|uniref:Uncharacterized protein n=1 Tax=Marininema halotolerans TaxID=1155944 RepID=A0A1I6RQC9_9BACL|nr:hypothetical protein SAMN05444972_105291 [Marininema halotolerans]
MKKATVLLFQGFQKTVDKLLFVDSFFLEIN